MTKKTFNTFLCLFSSAAILLGPCAVEAQAVPGKTLAHRSCGFEALNNSWTLDETGFAGAYIVQQSDGLIRFSVEVSGDAGASSDPVMDVHIGGRKWTYTVSGSNQTFTESGIEMPAGTHVVRVELTRGTPEFDRRLTIHSLEVTDNAGTVSRISNLDNEVNALNSADSYIANWRRGAFSLTVKDSSGQNVAAGSQVRVRLRRHAFNFGACLTGVNMRAKWLENSVNGINFREKISRQPMFSMLGCDNGAKWKQQERIRDSEYYTYADAALDFAEANDMRFRWHTLMWGSHDPEWANDLKLAAQKQITISGVTHPLLNGTYKYNRPIMSGEMYGSKINNITYHVYRWRNPSNLSEVKWLIGSSRPATVYFSSTEEVASPFDVTNWIPQNGATGSPVFTDLAVGAASRQELKAEITERVQGVVRQRAHRYAEIDGINESFNVELPVRALGMDGAAALYDEMGTAANQAAAEHGTPTAKIYLNDYAILKGAYNLNRSNRLATPGGKDWYRNFYRRHVEGFITSGSESTVGGIGIQGHVRGDLPDEDNTGTRRITLKTYRKPFQTLAVLEKPISITEFSLDADTAAGWSDAEKYDVVNKAMRIVFGSDQTTTFHYWGFYDPWDGVFTGLYNADWSLSPVGQAWQDLTTQQWYTETVLTVDANGKVDVPDAFYGDYIIEGTNGFVFSAEATLDADNASVVVFDNGAGNAYPTASISAPTNGLTVSSGQSVAFAGSGDDPEDGVITATGLIWTSSIDGQIGSGTGFSTTTLNTGTHTITLTVTDSAGLTDTASISLTVEAPSPDADGDGMVDDWETLYFGGTNQTGGEANGDWDGDGFSNLSEYIAGTNPTNSASLYEITIVNTNGEIFVNYPAHAATGTLYQNKVRYYDLFSTLSLLTGTWNFVDGQTNVLGDGFIHSHTNQDVESKKFFRVRMHLKDL